jgi:hypothetical protein
VDGSKQRAPDACCSRRRLPLIWNTKVFPRAKRCRGVGSADHSQIDRWTHSPLYFFACSSDRECLIGVGLLSGKFLRGTLLLLFLQLPGTFLPLFFFPAETWKHVPYAPTLLGQYIIKNLVLVCAGLLVGATMRGGSVIADPQVADNAQWVQRIFERFRRRFGSDPKGASKSSARTRS